MTIAPELQKPELFTKLLMMTTSPNDAEALMAIRRANDILARSGLNWAEFIASHFTIVPDPFASIPEPHRNPHSNGRAPAPPSRPAPPPAPTPRQPPPPPMTAAQQHAQNQKYNRKKTAYKGPIDLNDL